MATKPKFKAADTSFNFGANVRRPKATSRKPKTTSRGGKGGGS